MPRYTKRHIYHPLSIMAENPVGYAFAIVPVGFCAGYFIRYRLSSYWERQQQSPQAMLKGQAIRFYQELERMHRRQAVMNHTILNNDNPAMRTTVANQNEALRQGNPLAEESYFYAHQRDIQRAQALLGEIRELKAKIAAESAAAS